MARSKSDTGVVLPEIEPDIERPVRREPASGGRGMTRKAAASVIAQQRRNIWGQIRFWSGWALAVVVLLSVGLGLLEFEQFVRHDNRFRLVSPVEIGEDSPSLHVEGARYTSRRKISELFERDFGRSLYNVPPADRRTELVRMPWVREASVTRIWPNTVAVKVVERQPVAFVAIKGADSVTQTNLIDAQGVLLPLPEQATFSLPVITGLRPQDRQEIREDRVQRVLTMMKDLGPVADKVSEVSVVEKNNLKATIQMDQRALLLYMGDRDYSHRLQRFLKNYDEIRRNRPDATKFDVRLENSIVAIAE